MEFFFLKKGHWEILVCETFSVPPNSAPSLRLWGAGSSWRGKQYRNSL